MLVIGNLAEGGLMSGFGSRLLLVFLLAVVSAVMPAVSVLPAQAAPQMKGSGTAIPGELYGVSASSASNAWAAGTYCTTSACSVSDALLVHWNGTKWSKVAGPNPGSGSHLLDGVDAV